MKSILILLFAVCSFASFGQTLIDPSASPTTGRINDAISGALTASGTDTYTVSVLGSYSYTYLSGKAVSVTFTNVNTTSSTLDFDGLGSKNIKKWSGGSLTNVSAGDLIGTIRLRYDGTQFVMEGGSGSGGGGSGTNNALPPVTKTTSFTLAATDTSRMMIIDAATPTIITLPDLSAIDIGMQYVGFRKQTDTIYFASGGQTYLASAGNLGGVPVNSYFYIYYNYVANEFYISNGYTGSTSSGDMVLASTQTNTGAKTFNYNTFLLNNSTGTFSTTLNGSGSATVNRLIEFPDAAGTVALNPSTTTGDLIQATSATVLGRLAAVATGNALISGGVGTVSSWGKIGISTHVSGLGTGVATWLGTPSWANFNSAITGTAPYYSLATGGTATGTNTFTLSTNPLIFSTGVSTGTGATAGIQLAANSLTTGNAWDVSSSSITTGSLGKYTSTSTSVNHTAGSGGLFTVNSSGANSTSGKTTIGASFIVTNTGTTSVNVPAYFEATGGATNYSLQTGTAPLLINNARMYSVNTSNLFWGVAAGSLALSGGSGIENIGIGTNAGAALTTGNRNTYLGYNAGATQIGGFNNTFIGNAAGRLATGSANTYVGKSAGETNAAGASNTGVGQNALAVITSGGSNTALGVGTLTANSTQNNMTAIGGNALGSLTAGTQNTAVGFNSGFTATSVSNLVAVGLNSAFNVTGSGNVALGVEAMSGTGTFGSGPNTGAQNVFIGNSAGDFMQAGDHNVAVGSAALAAANSGGENTAIGYNTLNALSTGTYNVAIGSGTGSTLSSGSNNVLIGKQLTPTSLTGDNQLSIMNAIFGTGNSAVGTSISTGNIGILTAAPNSTLDVKGSFAKELTSTSADLTLSVLHSTVLVDASGANRTITLPAASGATRRIYTVKKVDSSGNTVTVDGNASETIDGATTYVMSAQWKYVSFQTDGTGWYIIANN